MENIKTFSKTNNAKGDDFTSLKWHGYCQMFGEFGGFWGYKSV